MVHSGKLGTAIEPGGYPAAMSVVNADMVDSWLHEAGRQLRVDPRLTRSVALRVLGQTMPLSDSHRARAGLLAAEACLQLRQPHPAVEHLLATWTDDLTAACERALGTAYAMLGHLDAALDAFVAAAAAEPSALEDFQILLQRANALRRHGRSTEAASIYDQLLARPDPECVGPLGYAGRGLRTVLWLNAASCMHQIGRGAYALDLLDRVDAQTDAGAHGPAVASWSMALRAWSHRSLGNEPEAAVLASATRASAAELAPYASATRVLARCVPPVDAVRCLEELVARLEGADREPDLADTLEELALACSDAGDHSQAYRTQVRAARVRRRVVHAAQRRCRSAELLRLRRQRQRLEAQAMAERNRQLAGRAATLALGREREVQRARSLAHDLRNPLTVLIGALELMDGGSRPDLMQSMVAHADRMLAMLDQVLADESPAADAERVSVDLPGLVVSIVGAYQSRAERKGITLANARAAPVMIQVNPVWIARIVDNLVGNALAVSSSGGRVDVQVQVGAHVVLTVLDRGPGFADDDVSRLFEDGVTGSARPTSGESSSGHGLFVVKCLTDALGGSVVAGNRDDGVGAYVRVTWPVTGPEGLSAG